MGLIDTHCHIHSPGYDLSPDEVIEAARADGVDQLVCVGTDAADSHRAVDFAADRDGCWASIGLHPHDARLGRESFEVLAGLIDNPKVVAVGECGLDYYYGYSPKADQLKALRFQLDLASQHDLPVIFHVREAFDDFWPVFDSYGSAGQRMRGVVHSFSAGAKELKQILDRGLYVGLNGIMMFTSNPDQLAAAKAVPLDKLVLETDSPFLTPPPYRGKVNQPRYVGLIADFLAKLRQEPAAAFKNATSQNAISLFNLGKPS